MNPLKFRPATIGTIWGSEDWILSAMEGRQAVCISGGSVGDESCADAGLELSELVSKYRERLVGSKVWARFGERFPMLVKYINSNQQLSVQVHPNDLMAKEKGLPNGKTEMWYVLKAEEDAELLLGFSKRFSPEEFKEIVNNSIKEKDTKKGEKTLEDVLNRFNPKRGDWYFIPAGTVHSIGAGVKILEIQQPSDTTYRLYDFNRVDIEGKRRHLDLEDAIAAIDFEEKNEECVERQLNVFSHDFSDSPSVELANCEHFASSFINLESDGSEVARMMSLDNSKWGTFTVIVCTGGSGKLFFRQMPGTCIRESVPVSDGDLYLIPAELGAVELGTDGNLQLVEAHLELK